MGDTLVGSDPSQRRDLMGRMRPWIGRRVRVHMRDGSRLVGILRDVALAFLIIELLEPIRRSDVDCDGDRAMAVINMEHVMFVTAAV